MNTQEKIEQRRKEAAKAQSLNKKRAKSAINDLFWKKVAAVAIVVVVLAGICALLFPQMAWSRRAVTAVTIGDEKVSAAEFSYYYRSAYNNYYNTLVNYLGEGNVPIDTNVSLKKQMMTEDTTYADYFTSSAISTLQNLIAAEKEAKANGFMLPQDYQDQFEQIKQTMDSYAQAYNVTPAEYLSRTYGFGFNQDLFEKVLQRELLAAAYQEAKAASITYTDEELEALYQANKTTYDTADVRIVQFASANADEANGVEEVTVAQAKADADAFLAKVTDEASYEAAAYDKLMETAAEGEDVTNKSLFTNLDFTAANSLDAKVASFIFNEEHEAGECAVVEGNSGVNFYVVYISRPASREEARAVNVRHILIQCDVNDEAASAEAKELAENILQQWLDMGKDEESFAMLAASYSEDPGSKDKGGLYENVTPGTMVATFNDWCFDPARQVGDFGVVETDYGYHIMYLAGQGEETWKLNLTNTQREADINAWMTANVAELTTTTHWLGMQLRNEPIGY